MAVLLILIVTFTSLSQAQQCERNGRVRLADTSTMYEGRVEVCIRGQWRTVCNDFWGQNEALVVCRQLGFSTSGSEQFIDLRMSGGPVTGIDDTNCTGSEQRLLDCPFSTETSDCNSDSHKVGVRCHEERKPKNPTSTFVGESMLSLQWEAPERGITNEQVQSYDVECFYNTQDGAAYSLKHSVGRDTTEVILPTTDPPVDGDYNCCIEAVFETYSSKACTFVSSGRKDALTDVLENQLLNSCPNNDTLVQTVPGVLSALIIILLVMLLLVSLALVYTWWKMSKIKQMPTPGNVASGATVSGPLGNPTYGRQEGNDSTSRLAIRPTTVLTTKSSFGAYSSTGPEYEPVYSAKSAGNTLSSNGLQTSAIQSSVQKLEAAPYEVPVNTGTLTMT